VMVFCLASLCLSYETNVNVMIVNAALAVECTCGTIASVIGRASWKIGARRRQ